jgi:hypothetical protein
MFLPAAIGMFDVISGTSSAGQKRLEMHELAFQNVKRKPTNTTHDFGVSRQGVTLRVYREVTHIVADSNADGRIDVGYGGNLHQ